MMHLLHPEPQEKETAVALEAAAVAVDDARCAQSPEKRRLAAAVVRVAPRAKRRPVAVRVEHGYE
jgi:hypothetical protein